MATGYRNDWIRQAPAADRERGFAGETSQGLEVTLTVGPTGFLTTEARAAGVLVRRIHRVVAIDRLRPGGRDPSSTTEPAGRACAVHHLDPGSGGGRAREPVEQDPHVVEELAQLALGRRRGVAVEGLVAEAPGRVEPPEERSGRRAKERCRALDRRPVVTGLARHPVAGEDEQAGAGLIAGLVRDGHRPVAIDPGEDVSREGMVGA